MQVTVEIPDQYFSHIVPEGHSAPRALLEEAVAGAYRDGRLKSVEQVRELLGFGTRAQTTTFLLQHEIYDYTIDDLDTDFAVLEQLFPAKPEQPLK